MVNSSDGSSVPVDHSKLARQWKSLKDGSVFSSLYYTDKAEDKQHPVELQRVVSKGKNLIVHASPVADESGLSGISKDLLTPIFISGTSAISKGKVSSLSLSAALPAPGDSTLSGLATSLTGLRPFGFDKSFAIPGASTKVDLELNGDPSLNPDLEIPGLLDITDLDKYSFALDVGFDST